VRVAILGPLVVEHDGAPVLIGGQRLRALFIRLALEPGRWVGAAALAGALWDGEQAPAVPLNALQSLVSRLRRLLPDPGILESSASGYRLCVNPGDVDASRFEALVTEGRRALAAGRSADAGRAFDEAHALWHGPALADLDGSSFTQPFVIHLEQLRRAADEDRYEAALQLGRHSEIVPELESLVAAEPLRERAAAQLIRALSAAGRQADALSAYDRTRTALVEELGLDPSPELAAAHQAVLVGAPPRDTAGAPKAPRNNLPTALTSFVGRDSELDQIGQLLGSHRLVTLTGPGGAGKTRLAIAAAQRATDAPSGIWLVELAPVSDPDEIAAATLGALSAREMNLLDTSTANTSRPTTSRDALSRLVDLLGERHVLLVLDNCEHLVGGAAQLADEVLGHCPHLRILATSREPLAIFGEAICPVLPLGMPRIGMSAAETLTFASVRLFADRAAAVSPGFIVDEKSVAAVIEICRRLDGLPLAIELAAARLRTLPVAVVAERLIDRFRLLTGGSRTAVARHQTLRSVVSWSWELLTTEERALAESLAVFHGGVTVESATAVSGSGYDDTMELLVALADKSILQPVSGQALRWRMLETLREYGAEQLAAQGRTDEVRRAHAEFFCALAERCEPELRTPRQLENVKLLGADRDNLNAGMRYSIDSGDVTTAVRYGAGLAWYWHLVGAEVEASGWLGQIVELLGAKQEPGYAICLAGWAFTLAGLDGNRSHAVKQRALELLEELLPDAKLDAHPLLVLLEVGVAMLQDDHSAASAAINRQLNHPDPWSRAAMQMISGLIAENSGDLEGLRRASADALAGFRAAGDRWGVSMSLAMSAGAAVTDGELATALEQYAEAVELLEDLGSTDDVAYLLMRQSQALERSGDRPAAHAALQRAYELAEQGGSASILAMAEFAVSLELGSGDEPEKAREFLISALQRAENVAHMAPQATASMYCALSRIQRQAGELEAARESAASAWQVAKTSHDMPVVAFSGTTLAAIVLAGGEPETAARLLGAADSVRGTPDRSDPEALALITEAREAIGDAADAARSAGQALSREAALELLEQHLSPAG
jgi:predicted ATPase/DNA-binding SARP family transcriptional activator